MSMALSIQVNVEKRGTFITQEFNIVYKRIILKQDIIWAQMQASDEVRTEVVASRVNKVLSGSQSIRQSVKIVREPDKKRCLVYHRVWQASQSGFALILVAESHNYPEYKADITGAQCCNR